jgi:hypothetical protein
MGRFDCITENQNFRDFMSLENLDFKELQKIRTFRDFMSLENLDFKELQKGVKRKDR